MPFKSGKCLLRYRLIEAEMEPIELASALKMPISQVSDYMATRKRMSLDTLYNVSCVIGCSMESLYEWEEVSISNRKRRR